VGALGIAQIMPGTGRDLAKRLGVDPFTSPHVAKFAIPAGAAYMAQLRGQWARGRLPLDKHWLAAASYNRGTGNIIRDQAECGDALLWAAISVCTARHTPETPAYVRRINDYWQLMERNK
jgi:soluble lytic murein transglycosylase-like protein